MSPARYLNWTFSGFFYCCSLDILNETLPEEEARAQKAKEEEAVALEFEKWKWAFSIDDEGVTESEVADGTQDLLSNFVNYIKHKCIPLEDLAAEFKLRTLGPQYVCTTFWTFVCTTCSGIHREFTHRVKSVSMATFTSHEVEALQNGGNQRAIEKYLRDRDSQRKRLTDNSNAEKIRQFIKDVYVDKKYATPNSSDKPPRD